MYPFIVEDKSKRKTLLSNCLYPIKQLWPKGVLKRYMNFSDVFTSKRKEMFDAYEASGGEYHGQQEENNSADATTTQEYGDVELDCDKDFW